MVEHAVDEPGDRPHPRRVPLAAVPVDLRQGLGRYFAYDNEGRLHQALDYRTPGAVYRAGRR